MIWLSKDASVHAIFVLPNFGWDFLILVVRLIFSQRREKEHDMSILEEKLLAEIKNHRYDRGVAPNRATSDRADLRGSPGEHSSEKTSQP